MCNYDKNIQKRQVLQVSQSIRERSIEATVPKDPVKLPLKCATYSEENKQSITEIAEKTDKKKGPETLDLFSFKKTINQENICTVHPRLSNFQCMEEQCESLHDFCSPGTYKVVTVNQHQRGLENEQCQFMKL